MKVEFWFDPACPFCWMTSRWITAIAPVRGLEIDWRPISLLFKNATPRNSPMYPTVERTRNLLRVVESLRADGQTARIADVYTQFGVKIHHEHDPFFDVAEVLNSIGLDPIHALALDDDRFDMNILDEMDDGLDLVGTDVGTPIIAITTAQGRVGLFGPVITEMPPTAAARLQLWEAFVAAAATPSFYELKRTRRNPPDITTIELG